jgi:hypothetical protein
MLPTRLELARSGLRAALQDMALGEERAHAFLDAYSDLPRERQQGLAEAIAALDHVDAALHDLRIAVRRLESSNAGPEDLVQLRERPRPSAVAR